MPNFLSHLSCFATTTKEYISNQIDMLFSLGWVAPKKSPMINEFQYSLKIHTLTDVSVLHEVGLPMFSVKNFPPSILSLPANSF